MPHRASCSRNSTKKVEKLNGQWQLEEMEINNVQTGSRTRTEFNFDQK
jgi:hypothetical protein